MSKIFMKLCHFKALNHDPLRLNAMILYCTFINIFKNYLAFKITLCLIHFYQDKKIACFSSNESTRKIDLHKIFTN